MDMLMCHLGKLVIDEWMDLYCENYKYAMAKLTTHITLYYIIYFIILNIEQL